VIGVVERGRDEAVALAVARDLAEQHLHAPFQGICANLSTVAISSVGSRR
jgi:hypothetical protein